MASGINGGVSDVPVRWAHGMNGSLHNMKQKGGASFPSHDALMTNLIVAKAEPDMHSVLIKLPDQESLFEIRQWLEEQGAEYKQYFRVSWEDRGVQVTRDPVGLKFHFKDQDMAVFFKFRWASGF